jgi:hypothetical protein
MEIVRVLRVLEYIGPREEIERVLKHSIHGEKSYGAGLHEVTIKAATIGEFPEIFCREKKDGQVPLQHG